MGMGACARRRTGRRRGELVPASSAIMAALREGLECEVLTKGRCDIRGVGRPGLSVCSCSCSHVFTIAPAGLTGSRSGTAGFHCRLAARRGGHGRHALPAPAFAAVTRWWGPDRVRALTIVTLAGGLASTAFAPLMATFAEHVSWRTTYAVLAAILAAITIPRLCPRAPGPLAGSSSRPAEQADGSWPVARSGPFLMLAAAFTLNGFAIYAVVSARVPLLTDRGATPTAAA